MRKISFAIIITMMLATGHASTLCAQEQQTKQEEAATDEAKHEVKIEIVRNKLKITDLKQDSVVEIFSIFGTKVQTIRVSAGTNEYPLNLRRGYYIVKINKTVKKIAIK